MKIDFAIWYWELRLKWAKLKKWFFDLQDWLYFHEPVFCAVCSKIVIRNKTKIVQPLTGGTVRICEECYKIHFPDGEK